MLTSKLAFAVVAAVMLFGCIGDDSEFAYQFDADSPEPVVFDPHDEAIPDVVLADDGTDNVDVAEGDESNETYIEYGDDLVAQQGLADQEGDGQLGGTAMLAGDACTGTMGTHWGCATNGNLHVCLDSNTAHNCWQSTMIWLGGGTVPLCAWVDNGAVNGKRCSTTNYISSYKVISFLTPEAWGSAYGLFFIWYAP
jgi:hypothetical protein